MIEVILSIAIHCFLGMLACMFLLIFAFGINSEKEYREKAKTLLESVFVLMMSISLGLGIYTGRERAKRHKFRQDSVKSLARIYINDNKSGWQVSNIEYGFTHVTGIAYADNVRMDFKLPYQWKCPDVSFKPITETKTTVYKGSLLLEEKKLMK